jgi:predicted RNase H-like HicB family nuclease
VKKIIQFTVTKDRGVYTANGVNVPIVTEGRTSAELQTNIQEAVELYLEGDNAGPYRLSDAEISAVRQGIDAAAMGHFAPDDEMEEFYRLHRRV